MKFTVKVWYWEVKVCVGEPFYSFQKWVLRNEDSHTGDRCGCGGTHVVTHLRNPRSYIWIEQDPCEVWDRDDESVVYHESYHAAEAYIEHSGDCIGRGNEEIRALFQGYVACGILEKIDAYRQARSK